MIFTFICPTETTVVPGEDTCEGEQVIEFEEKEKVFIPGTETCAEKEVYIHTCNEEQVVHPKIP